MSNVLTFAKPKDPEEATPDDVLNQAMGKYRTVLTIGWDHNDTLLAHASPDLNIMEAIYLGNKFLDYMMELDSHDE